MTRKEFGAIIKSVRNERGLSQSQLAEQAEVPLWAVAQGETGKAVGDKMPKIAEFLGVPMPASFSEPADKPAPKKRGRKKAEVSTVPATSGTVQISLRVKDLFALIEKVNSMPKHQRELLRQALNE